MKILLLTDSYPPEIRSASHLMYEFANELRTKGYQVTVVTTMPRYNLIKDQAVEEYKTVTYEGDIKVIRINSLPLHKVGYLMRGIAHLTLPFVFYRAVKKLISNRQDIIMAYSPPLTLGIAGVWLKNYFSSKFVLNIQDIFPQNAIDLGIIRNAWIIKLFEGIEKWIYKRVDRITVHSDGNKRFLMKKKDLSSDKIDVVYNWANWSFFNRATNTLNFRKLYNLDSKLVILFAGIIGPAQGLDVIINAAKKLEDKSKAHFVFVGDGTEKKKLRNKAKELKLSNVSFQPFISKEDYPFLLKEVDVGLVCLSKYNKTPVVPGKLMGYMASGLPVLAVLNRESDGHEIIKHTECGFSLYPDDEDGIVGAVLQLENDSKARRNMGKNGKKFTQSHFSRKDAVDRYEKIFKGVLGG